MERPPKFRILDAQGQPVEPRLETVLTSLAPRLQRHFPTFRDETLLIEVLEEAGRRIAHREADHGPIERLHPYAWVTLRNVALSRVRAGAGRLAARTVSPQDGDGLLDSRPTAHGTAEQVEHRILLREILDTLTAEERLICLWKQAGYSSLEIAGRRGGSPAAVDTLVSRIRQKVRALMERPSGSAGDTSSSQPGGPRAGAAGHRARVEDSDGT